LIISSFSALSTWVEGKGRVNGLKLLSISKVVQAWALENLLLLLMLCFVASVRTEGHQILDH